MLAIAPFEFSFFQSRSSKFKGELFEFCLSSKLHRGGTDSNDMTCHLLFLVSTLLCLSCIAASNPDIDKVVDGAQKQLFASKKADNSYSFPPYLGPNYISQYYVMLSCLCFVFVFSFQTKEIFWANPNPSGLNISSTLLNTSRLMEVLYEQQLVRSFLSCS